MAAWLYLTFYKQHGHLMKKKYLLFWWRMLLTDVIYPAKEPTPQFVSIRLRSWYQTTYHYYQMSLRYNTTVEADVILWKTSSKIVSFEAFKCKIFKRQQYKSIIFKFVVCPSFKANMTIIVAYFNMALLDHPMYTIRYITYTLSEN